MTGFGRIEPFVEWQGKRLLMVVRHQNRNSAKVLVLSSTQPV